MSNTDQSKAQGDTLRILNSQVARKQLDLENEMQGTESAAPKSRKSSQNVAKDS